MGEFEIYKNLNMLIFSATLSANKNEQGEIKKEFKPLCKWKEQTESIIDINNNCFFVATGLKSGCTVIDLDNMETEKNKQLHAYCLGYCNLIVKTKKGFHYYFDYTEELKTTTNIIKGVDIRNDGGCAIIPPTYYYYDSDNKKIKITYRIINEPQEEKLKPINDDILNLLKEDKEPKPEKQTKTTETQNKRKILKVNSDIMKDVLMALKIERYTDYKMWANVLFACKCEGTDEYYEQFNIFSMQSPKYDNKKVKNYWNNYTPKDNINIYTYNSLLYWLNKDNKTKYDEIVQKYNIFKIEDEEIIMDNVLEINQNYLLEDKKIKKCVVSKYINDFLKSEEIKTLNIKSPYNTGKSTLLTEICKKYNRILVIGYRITLNNNLYGLLKSLDFKIYTEGTDNNRLICQIDSLKNIVDLDYDLVIMDESESAINHFMANSLNDQYGTFNIMYSILKNAQKCIFLDGDIGNRTKILSNALGKSYNINNAILKDKKHFIFRKNINDFDDKINEKLKENKNIVIICMSEQIANQYYEKYSNTYSIMKYTSKTDDNDKKQLCEVNAVWPNYQIVIYTPCIESGVDFNTKHFDSIFIYLSAFSTSQRGLNQMIHRVRQTEDNNINVFLGSIMDNEKMTKRHYTIEEITTFYKNMSINLNKNGLSTIDNKTQQTKYNDFFDVYDMLQIYNKQECLNKNSNNFLPLFIQILTKKGHTYEMAGDKKIKIAKTENYVKQNIINAQSITKSDFELLQVAQRKQELNEDQKYEITKYLYENTFNIKLSDVEQLKTIYNKLGMIKNARELLNNEIDKKHLNNSDLFNNEKILKIQTLNKVLEVMNINPSNIINEPFVIDSETLKTKIEPINDILSKNNILYNNKKDVITTTNKLIGTLRSMFDAYGLNIESKQRTKRDKITKQTTKEGLYEFSFYPEIVEKLKIKSLFHIFDFVDIDDYIF